MTSARSSSALPIIKTLIFTVVVPGMLGVYVPIWMLSASGELGWKGARPLALLGIAAIVLGALGYFWCAWHFAVTGRGTPAPIDPPKVLVARGLYRYVRNPMYVSVLLVVLGQSLLFESSLLLTYALAGWAFFHLFVLLYEEPTLGNKFSKSYAEYCKTVPRWIPRFNRSKNL